MAKRKKKAQRRKSRRPGSPAGSRPRRRKAAGPRTRNEPRPQAAPVRSARAPRPGSGSVPELFESLAAILVPYARLFESEMHPRIGYCLKAKHGERQQKELYFGGVQLHQDHVSFHLFLLYSYPDLEEGLSPGLHRCLHGKTSFLFEPGAAPALFAELEELTRTCFERFRSEGLFGQAA
jgi:hypothetical protein